MLLVTMSTHWSVMMRKIVTKLIETQHCDKCNGQIETTICSVCKLDCCFKCKSIEYGEFCVNCIIKARPFMEKQRVKMKEQEKLWEIVKENTIAALQKQLLESEDESK